MRFVAVSTLVLAANFALVACSGDSGQPSQSKGGATSTTTPSTTATGGSGNQTTQSNQTGGNTASGGTANNQTGGTTSTGGTSLQTGGTSTGAGGKTGVGGKTSTGGSTATSSVGGKTSTGGAVGVGGAGGAGGKVTTPTGGAAPTGGTRATGGVTATGGMTTATGGAQSTGATVPRLTNGTSGWASRYWDCCKPSCGWSANTGGKTPVPSCSKDNARLSDYNAKNGCEGGGTAFECWDFAPWSVSDTLSYGFAAYNGVPCGTCFQIDFTGSAGHGNPASAGALSNKSMIVQVINIGGIESNQFDLLIPGGGVGAMNGCSTQWGVSNDQLGAQYGGFLTSCNGDKSCVQNKCSTLFGSRAGLKAGCDWFLGWFNGADNPDIKYSKVSCPAAITSKSGMSG